MKVIHTGQYVTGKSILHRLSAMCKLVEFFALLAAVILTNTLTGYLILCSIVGLLAMVSKIGWRRTFASVWELRIFFLVIFFMNAFFHETQNPIADWWIFKLSNEGMAAGAQVIMRVILVLISGNILTATTPPLEITSALERLMMPLALLRIPTKEIAMILGVSLQFIPILSEEAEMIKKAQLARGARFNSHNFIERATSVMPLIVPVFVAAFRRADELSLAMEARGY